MNIPHQLFYYKITFVNLQHKKTNSKGNFVLKNVRFEYFWYTKINLTHIWYDDFNSYSLRLKVIPSTHDTIFQPKMINCIRQIKS